MSAPTWRSWIATRAWCVADGAVPVHGLPARYRPGRGGGRTWSRRPGRCARRAGSVAAHVSPDHDHWHADGVPPSPLRRLHGVRPQGPRARHGMLRIRAERIAERTRLTRVEQRPPLQVTRAHDLDADRARPGQRDHRQPGRWHPPGRPAAEPRSRSGPGRGCRVGSQSASRVYRAPATGAVSDTRLSVATGGYLEYLPDPWLPFADSRLDAATICVVDQDATLVVVGVGHGRPDRTWRTLRAGAIREPV